MAFLLSRVAWGMAFAWCLVVLVPDVVVHALDPTFDMTWRMRVSYLVVMGSSCLQWIVIGVAIAALRVRHPRAGWAALIAFALVAGTCSFGTVIYQLYFDYTPRPAIFAFLLQNLGYLGGLIVSSIGAWRQLLLFGAPLLLIAWFAFATRRPLRPLPAKGLCAAAVAIALFVPITNAVLPGRLSSLPPDFVGMRVAAAGARLWAGGADLPMLPVPQRMTLEPFVPAAAPNVLLIVNESVGTQQVSPWSASWGQPAAGAVHFASFLSERAEHSVWFTRATTVAPLTNLAFPAIVTGLDPGMPTASFKRAPLLWHEAAAAGYDVALISAQDFKYSLFRQFFLGPDRPATFKTAAELPGPRTVDSGADDAHAADAVLDFLATASRAKPFFVVVQFSGSHFPCWDPANPGDELLGVFDDARRQARCVGAVAHIDKQVGRILASLKARGDLDHTVVISTSDHGEAFDPARPRRPVNFHEDTMSVPLAISLPSSWGDERRAHVRALRVNRDRRVSNLDIFPTLLDLWGRWPIDPGADRPRLAGLSLLRPVPADRILISTGRSSLYEPPVEGFAFYRGHWKWLFDEKRGLHLYDLSTDLSESVNQVASPPAAELGPFLDAVRSDRRLATALRSNPAAAEGLRRLQR